MNTKLIVGLTILLIALIIISLFFTRQNPETTTLPQNTAIENTQITNEAQQPPVAQMIPPRRAVTIIGTPHKENKSASTLASGENRKQTIVENYQPQENVSSSSGSGATASSETEPGTTTQINKPPTPQELNEMRAKGIVLY